MSRVLQLIDSLNPGGAERMAVNIANAMAEKGYAAFLCTTRQEGLLKDSISSSVNYTFIGKSSALDIGALYRLRKFVKKNRVEIIHAHATSFFTATLIKILYPKVKIIWHDHYGNSEYLHKRPFRLLQFCSLFFSAVCCVNEILIKWNRETLYTKRIFFLPNFVDAPVNTKSIGDLKGSQGQRLICVANLRPQKDHISLIEAFKKVNVSHPNWTLHCVGYDFQDGYSKKVKDLVKQLNLESKVVFYGSRSDVTAFLNTCDIAILSSISEGLPLVLLEYGVCKMPVIATNVGDVAKVIKDKVTGLLIPPKNTDSLKNAIKRLISDKVLRVDLAENLHSYVQRELGVDKAIKTLSLIYKDSLK